MRKAIIVFLFAGYTTAFAQTAPLPQKIPVVFEEFGNKRVDNYYWMNNRDSATISHLKKENDYANAVLSSTKNLQEKIYNELKDAEPASLASLPFKKKGYWYYTQSRAEKPYVVYYRRKGTMQAKEETVLDVNLLAEGRTNLFAASPVVSPDNQQCVVSYDTKGDHRYTIKIKSITGNRFLPDSVDNTTGYAVWLPNGKGFYYLRADASSRPNQLLFHTVGSSTNADSLLYEEKDSLFYMNIDASSDGTKLFVSLSTGHSTELRFINLATGAASGLQMLVPRKTNTVYNIIDNHSSHFYIYTNDSARNFKIIRLEAGSPFEKAKTIIAETKDIYLQDCALVKDKLVVKQRRNGSPQLRVHSISSNDEYIINPGTAGGGIDFSFSDDPLVSDSIRIRLASYTVPAVDYAFNLVTRQRKKIREQETKNFNAGDYIESNILVKARDGAEVPLSIVYNKKLYKQDGLHPLFIETYSWYNDIEDGHFNTRLFPLLNRGVAFAFPHARGGGEKGPDWWDDGRRMHRMNTYFDVVDCAQYLVDKKYTSPAKMLLWGRSAGGTNIGAILNLRPDLFRAVVADVPWVDVITDMKNPDVPTVTAEYDEEGDPNIQTEYKYMLKWSPYDNVKGAVYPRLLATCSWNDTNVPFYHAAKWIAKVREMNKGTEPILLLTDFESGHSGLSNKFERFKSVALRYAFMLEAVDKKIQ